MTTFSRITESSEPPAGVKVLAYWEKTGHVEDVEFFHDDGLCYVLFDGETLNDFPSHWAEMPSVSK